MGHPEVLEQVGATKLADYTDQLARHYKIDSIDTQAYLNRAALVGCNNERLSQSYAKQLYTRKYLRNTSVTGRLGDIMEPRPIGTPISLCVNESGVVSSSNPNFRCSKTLPIFLELCVVQVDFSSSSQSKLR
jgi:hypothetical protein